MSIQISSHFIPNFPIRLYTLSTQKKNQCNRFLKVERCLKITNLCFTLEGKSKKGGWNEMLPNRFRQLDLRQPIRRRWSLSRRHLLHFSAVQYGVLTLGFAAGVPGPSLLSTTTFSWKQTLFFFDLPLFLWGSLDFASVVARDDDIDCCWAVLDEGFIAGFSASVLAGMFVLRLVPKTRLSLKQRRSNNLFEEVIKYRKSTREIKSTWKLGYP